MANKKQPPFFNEDNIGSLRYKLPFYDTMELFIETLTGTCFELRVSPFETVVCVKAQIEKLEGIPVSQQHLIWNNVELEDERSLKDYSISEGCTLKLVLAMRGGPINTRRVALEDPIREMAEYMDPIREEMGVKSPSNKQVTFLVYREGDQLNFFRVVDRGDGNLTPLSESLSGDSVYNLYPEDDDDDDAEDSPSGQQIIENSITMNKMKLLRSKMENMNLNKKPPKNYKLKPRPPMAPCPSSTLMASARHRFLRVLPHIGQSCLPLGNPHPSESSHNALSSLTAATRTIPSISGDYVNEDDPWNTSLLAPSLNSIVLPPKISRVELENVRHSKNTLLPPIPPLPKNNVLTQESDSILHQNLNFFSSEETTMPIDSFALLTEVGSVEQYGDWYSLGKVNPELGTAEGCKDSPSTEGLSKNLNSDVMETSIFNTGELSPPRNKFLSPIHFSTQTTPNAYPKPQRQPKCFEFGSLRPTTSHSLFRSVEVRNMADPSFSRTTTRFRSVKVDSPGKRSDVISKMEARDMTQVANKASKEPVGTLNNLEFLASLAPCTSRDNAQSSSNPGRLRHSGVAQPTNPLYPPEELSKRISTVDDNKEFISHHGLGEPLNNTVAGKHLVEATHLFPPVKSTFRNKKATKHCVVCRKKTGLATSYECRCGNNFCAIHRYAETHNCSYDYQAAGRRYLQEANPIITAPKLPKI
ncbi:LOW QUALITY PROTEIN: AN1-type zinc finger protein 4 [Pelodytes ibericus]